MDLAARRQAELPSSRRLFADFVEARLDHLFQRLAGIDHGKILSAEIEGELLVDNFGRGIGNVALPRTHPLPQRHTRHFKPDPGEGNADLGGKDSERFAFLLSRLNRIDDRRLAAFERKRRAFPASRIDKVR